MSDIRDGLMYTKTDEWVKIEDGIATIGITDYAQSHLGDIVFVESCEEEQEIKKEDVLTTVESVKSASDIYSPLTGKIIEFNSDIEEDAAILNKEPYEGGWICKIEIANEEELKDLLDSKEYAKTKE